MRFMHGRVRDFWERGAGWGSDPNVPERSMELVLAKRPGLPDRFLGAPQAPSRRAELRGRVKVGPHLTLLGGWGWPVLGLTRISGALVNIQSRANTYFVFCVSQTQNRLKT